MALDITPKQEGGKLKAVASGTLPSGVPVVVNADGTVSVIEGANVTQAAGVSVAFESDTISWTSTAYDVNSQKIVVAYTDVNNSAYGTAVVGTVSGTSISFGTPVVFESSNSTRLSATYDASIGKVVIVFRAGNNGGYGILGTVSGTSISFGTRASFDISSPLNISSTYDTNAQKIVICYEDGDNIDKGTAVVGTVTGPTSISFGTPVVYNNADTTIQSIAYDANAQKVVIAYHDNGNSSYGTAIVGTVSGTSISFGSPVVFNTAATNGIDIAYDASAQKVVITYFTGTGGDGIAIVGTVSGTSISFGSPVVFNTGAVSYNSIVYHAAAQKVVIAYSDLGNSNYGTAIAGTVSGTSISFGSKLVVESGRVNFVSAAYDPNEEAVVISYENVGNSEYGTSVVFQPAYISTNLTAENYIGMSGGVVVGESNPQQIGSETVFEADSTLGTGCGFDSNSNKVVIAYRDFGNSNYGTAVVGTVSGTSITFGTPVVFNSTGTTDENNVVFDSLNNKIVIVYQDGGNSAYGTAIVGTVSGDTISFGSPTVFVSQTLSHPSATFDTVNNKVVISYADNGNSAYGTAIVGTVSGTSISFGSSTVFESADTDNTAITFDSSNNKVVVAYQDAGNSNYGTAVVGTVSGTSISFGTPVIFESQDSDKIAITFDSASNKVVVVYQDDGGDNSRYGTAIVGTVSGTSISFGSPSIFESANTDSITASFDTNANKVVIQYRDGGNSDYGTLVFGTVDGSSITFTSPTVFNTGNTGGNSSVFDSNANKVVIAYQDGGNSAYGTAIVVQAGHENITRGQVADGGAATIDIVGTVSTNQVGLTAGQQYYVQTDGTVGETPADPSVLAGTALSATKMTVKS